MNYSSSAQAALQLFCSSGTSSKLHTGLKYSKTGGVWVISEGGRGGGEGLLELSQGAQAGNQCLKLFRGSGCWHNSGPGCLERLHRGANRENEALPGKGLRRVGGPVVSLLLPPPPAGSLLPGVYRSWECPCQERQTTPKHSSRPVQALLGPQTLHPGPPQPLRAGQEPWNWGSPWLPTSQHHGGMQGHQALLQQVQEALDGAGRQMRLLHFHSLRKLRIFIKKQARIWQQAEGGDVCQGLDSCTFFTSKLCDQRGPC